MNVFKYNSYQKFFADRIEEQKKINKSKGLLYIATQCQMHGSFLSSVLKERNHFNSDQMHSICKYCNLTNDEIDYFQTILELDKSVNKDRISFLKNKIKQLKQINLKTSKKLDIKKQDEKEINTIKYYSDAYYKVIHVFLGIKKFQDNYFLILDFLPINQNELRKYINDLADFGFIEIQKNRVKLLKENFHLDKDHFICRPHQSSMKSRSNNKIEILSEDKKESICVTYSCTENSHMAINEAFFNFLKQAQDIVSKDENKINKKPYQLNFDSFYWM